jgi:hypothetical protein
MCPSLTGQGMCQGLQASTRAVWSYRLTPTSAVLWSMVRAELLGLCMGQQCLLCGGDGRAAGPVYGQQRLLCGGDGRAAGPVYEAAVSVVWW